MQDEGDQMANLSGDEDGENTTPTKDKENSKKAANKKGKKRPSKKSLGDENGDDDGDGDSEARPAKEDFFKPRKSGAKRESSKANGAKIKWTGAKLWADDKTGRTFYAAAEVNGGETYR